MNKANIIASFIVSALVTVGIIYFALNRSYAPTQNLTTKISPTATPSSTKWEKFNSSGKFVFSTDDWQSYSSKNDNASFSIEYPADWSLDGSVFHDSNGKKVAELFPGLVVLKPGQKCFDTNSSGENIGNELISQTNITIGQLSGILRIEKVLYDGGSSKTLNTWYPNIYCLSDGNNAFVMSFYEEELNSNKRELFKKIIDTIKLI